MATSVSSQKVREALKVLDAVAKESGEDLEKMIKTDYKSFKKSLANAVPKIESAIEEYSHAAVDALDHAKKFAADKVTEAAHQVDENVHKNPYPFMIGTAVVGGLVGAALAKTFEHAAHK